MVRFWEIRRLLCWDVRSALSKALPQPYRAALWNAAYIKINAVRREGVGRFTGLPL
jgi:hypothetical protein